MWSLGTYNVGEYKAAVLLGDVCVWYLVTVVNMLLLEAISTGAGYISG